MNPLFTKIDFLKDRLNRLPPLKPAERQRLREEFIIEMTYNSNAIEGNTLTLRETDLILQEGITIAEKPLREHLDVIGFKDAFYYIIELASHNALLTEETIKTIHSLVLMNDRENRGKYRKVPVRIVSALHTPPQPYMIEPAIDRLLKQYAVWKAEKHILKAAALLHLEFESIHPFIDGNGRTGRLLLNLELIKAGLLPVDIKFTDRRKYYDCFDAYHRNANDPEQMAALISAYEQEELERYIAIVSP
ncbi:Fic family protein [uncultured Megasphaera sp.]|uniref:Fic family protein n=1 Tax=uncultured Megasphaera sp. TaxID=165188 RepID=UPI0025DEBD2E|nr:Fic family protein [uncultured Megasphaera sp.]